MDAGEDTHRHVTRIVADKHLIDFEYRAEFAVQNFRGNVRQVEIDLVLAADAHTVDADLEYLARGDVAWYEVAIAGYFSSRKYQRSRSGIDDGARVSPLVRGTQTR